MFYHRCEKHLFIKTHIQMVDNKAADDVQGGVLHDVNK